MTNKNINNINKIPKLQEMYKLLKECDFIKYAAYRIGAKIHILQKHLYMEEVRLGIVAGVFERHGYNNLENILTISTSELESIIYDIYFAAEKERQKNIDVDNATDLMLSFLVNLFSGQENQRVQIFTIKIILIILSESKLQAKFHYFYEQIADSSNYISRNNFTSLIENLQKLPLILSNNSFGGPTNSIVDNFFQKCPSPFGATEQEYFQWLRHEPPVIGWLCALHRIQAGLNVVHNFKCAGCRTYPIHGLRYRCLRCLVYDQCQTCFFTGRYTRGHKSCHPMQEYCYQTSSKENTINFFKVLLNKLSKSPQRTQPTINKVTTVERDDSTSLELVSISKDFSESLGHSPPSELQSIISHLDNENRHLHKTIEQLLTRCHDLELIESYLKEHRNRVQTQLHRLHHLKNHLTTRSPPKRLLRLESTPLMRPAKFLGNLHSLKDLSPIPKVQDTPQWCLSPKNLQTKYDQTPNKKSEERNAFNISTDTELSTWIYTALPKKKSEQSGFNTWLEEAGMSKNERLEKNNSLKFNELDQAMEQLHDMLNISLHDQDPMDNDQLQKAAKEMENLLTNLIDSIQKNKDKNLN